MRQYLKQKIQRAYMGKRPDMEILKKELRDEITHILYDETRRTPIVIPVINEVGDGQQSAQNGNQNPRRSINPKVLKQPLPDPQNRHLNIHHQPEVYEP